jgi:hypothetical protein
MQLGDAPDSRSLTTGRVKEKNIPAATAQAKRNESRKTAKTAPSARGSTKAGRNREFTCCRYRPGRPMTSKANSPTNTSVVADGSGTTLGPLVTLTATAVLSTVLSSLVWKTDSLSSLCVDKLLNANAGKSAPIGVSARPETTDKSTTTTAMRTCIAFMFLSSF